MEITINGTISEVMEFFSQFQGMKRNAGAAKAKSETPPAMTSDKRISAGNADYICQTPQDDPGHIVTAEDFKRPLMDRLNLTSGQKSL